MSSTNGHTNGRRPRLRLLHTSDVHLGAYDSSSGQQREELHATFERVIDVALRERVDAVLVAGDFFDNARVREETLTFAAEQITRLDCPFVVCPGNHDHVGVRSVYDRVDFSALAPNLHLIRDPEGEVLALESLELEVWGRPHTEVGDFRPFEELPPRGEAAWQLGIGHGHYIHPRALLHHSFHIREEHLAAAERDYVALGHWETPARVAAGGRVAAYSGAPEALGYSDIGGLVLIVDLMEDGEVRLTGHSVRGEAPPIAHEELPLLEGA